MPFVILPFLIMKSRGVIYQYRPWGKVGLGLLALALGGLTGPLIPVLRLEAGYLSSKLSTKHQALSAPLPKAVPVVFDPLVTPDGGSIDPLNLEFGLVVPKIGINAAIIPAVNPTQPGEYLAALEKGVAHSSLSYFPDEDGTVYLFSHSTNYDWFVRDLNAVFYLLKNLEEGDLVVLFYKGSRYTYKLSQKQVVPSTAISYLVPEAGRKRLILQTCWPPGTTTERLLIFADLVEEYGTTI